MIVKAELIIAKGWYLLYILTSKRVLRMRKRHAKHPFAGQNIQQVLFVLLNYINHIILPLYYNIVSPGIIILHTLSHVLMK